VKNAIRFYADLADLFPDLSIQIYHNPALHRIHIPVAAFHEIVKSPNIVSMKETTCRYPLEFMRVMDILKGKISVFVPQNQYYPYALHGARGVWSTTCWMGPWPILRLLDVVDSGDFAAAEEVLRDLAPTAGPASEGAEPQDYARKLAANTTGYADEGPNRPPFMEIEPASMERALKAAQRWQALCDKYRPLVEARAAVAVR
jgi:trans-o-hydroxybenzylidenepyruvate hydratase-aldolase